MKEFTVTFWTPGIKLDQNPRQFGCASHGFATDLKWVGPEQGESVSWKEKFKGSLISGDYEEVLNNLGNLGDTPSVCLTFFSKPLGVEHFLMRFHELLPDVPLIGGGAAIGEDQSQGEVLPLAEDVVLFAAFEVDFELHSLNIYDQTDIEVEIDKTSSREFNKVRLLPDGKWQNALDFYRHQQEIRGINPNDFESLTFQDLNKRNIHCSEKGNQILTGANLPDNCRLRLCLVDRRDATQRLSEFISKERSLVIGCAGIRSLIVEPLTSGKNSLVGFLFGEVVTCKTQPMFGNLMLARLTLK